MSNSNVFEDKERLYFLLNLRRIGFSFTELALFFDTSRQAVLYQCRKYKIEPLVKSLRGSGNNTSVSNIEKNILKGIINDIRIEKKEEKRHLIKYNDYLKDYKKREKDFLLRKDVYL